MRHGMNGDVFYWLLTVNYPQARWSRKQGRDVERGKRWVHIGSHGERAGERERGRKKRVIGRRKEQYAKRERHTERR